VTWTTTRTKSSLSFKLRRLLWQSGLVGDSCFSASQNCKSGLNSFVLPNENFTHNDKQSCIIEATNWKLYENASVVAIWGSLSATRECGGRRMGLSFIRSAIAANQGSVPLGTNAAATTTTSIGCCNWFGGPVESQPSGDNDPCQWREHDQQQRDRCCLESRVGPALIFVIATTFIVFVQQSTESSR
jgi:hypothetical protein